MDAVRNAYAAPQPDTGKGRAAAPDVRTQPEVANTTDAGPQRGSPAAPAAQTDGARPSLEELQQLLEQVSRHIHQERRSLAFEVREELGRAIVSVYDADTEELIRQIPPETIVRIAATMKELIQQGGSAGSGLLLSEQA